MLTRKQLEQCALDVFYSSPARFVPKDGIYSEGCGGMPIYDEPIFAFGAANDPLFEALKDPSVIGAHHSTPQFWVPDAKTVISMFLPFSDEIKAANNRDNTWPSNSWYHARIEGQRFLLSICFAVADLLAEEGWLAAVPDSSESPDRPDSRFKMGATVQTPQGEKRIPYTSNWSVRHAAYICGLGTFSLSRSLITRKGCAGRYGSIITDLELPADERPYSAPYEYCSRCGACIPKCPAGAITLADGKNNAACGLFLRQTKENPPYYGCGKCQIGVPCESRIPRGETL